MWQYKVLFSKSHKNEVVEFCKKIKRIKNIDYKMHNDNKFIIVDIYCNNITSHIKESVLTIIASTLVAIYKSDFFSQSIKSDLLSPSQKNSLIKALVGFDIEADIFYVLNNLTMKSTLIAPSFYLFCMVKLVNKWQEFVTITNLNSMYLLNIEVYIEFLKFLLSCSTPQENNVNVYCKNNHFVFEDNQNNCLADNVAIDDEIGLITNLVLLYPYKINIHCINQVSNKTFKMLYYLFNKKINLLV